MVMPSFPWALEFTSPSFRLLGHESGTYVKKGDEIIDAEALDGTTIPAYLATNVRQTKWHDEMMKTMDSATDPLWTVIREGGPFHARGQLPRYGEFLKDTDRAYAIEELGRRHPGEFGAATRYH